MRSIKYRAFYKGEMRQVTALEWIHEGEDLAGCYLTGIDKCVIVNDDETTFGVDLLEFTGLHDRNGTEIYESDVVVGKPPNYTDEVKGVVKYGALAFAFVGKTKKGKEWFDTITNPRIKKADHVEVIGNIYENPGLLKGE